MSLLLRRRLHRNRIISKYGQCLGDEYYAGYTAESILSITSLQGNISLQRLIIMPSILSETDKETVKRTVPKASNKIHAVAVARLYVAHPDKQRWTYTGLQGAAVLANDLVGNTYWIKLVDISVSYASRDCDS